MDRLLILPGDPEWTLTLGGSLPPGWQDTAANTGGDFAFVARSGSGLLEAVPWHEAVEYMEGGEWDERMEEIGEDENWEE